MAAAITVKDAGGSTLFEVKGMTLEGLTISPRRQQIIDRKFWGVSGISRIDGGYREREIIIPVLIYDATDFDTARKLTFFIDRTLNTIEPGTIATLNVNSESDHDAFLDCTFEGATIVEGPMHDDAGTLGGGWWATILLGFTQLS